MKDDLIEYDIETSFRDILKNAHFEINTLIKKQENILKNGRITSQNGKRKVKQIIENFNKEYLEIRKNYDKYGFYFKSINFKYDYNVDYYKNKENFLNFLKDKIEEIKKEEDILFTEFDFPEGLDFSIKNLSAGTSEVVASVMSTNTTSNNALVIKGEVDKIKELDSKLPTIFINLISQDNNSSVELEEIINEVKYLRNLLEELYNWDENHTFKAEAFEYSSLEEVIEKFKDFYKKNREEYLNKEGELRKFNYQSIIAKLLKIYNNIENIDKEKIVDYGMLAYSKDSLVEFNIKKIEEILDKISIALGQKINKKENNSKNDLDYIKTLFKFISIKIHPDTKGDNFSYIEGSMIAELSDIVGKLKKEDKIINNTKINTSENYMLFIISILKIKKLIEDEEENYTDNELYTSIEKFLK